MCFDQYVCHNNKELGFSPQQLQKIFSTSDLEGVHDDNEFILHLVACAEEQNLKLTADMWLDLFEKTRHDRLFNIAGVLEICTSEGLEEKKQTNIDIHANTLKVLLETLYLMYAKYPNVEGEFSKSKPEDNIWGVEKLFKSLITHNKTNSLSLERADFLKFFDTFKSHFTSIQDRGDIFSSLLWNNQEQALGLSVEDLIKIKQTGNFNQNVYYCIILMSGRHVNLDFSAEELEKYFNLKENIDTMWIEGKKLFGFGSFDPEKMRSGVERHLLRLESIKPLAKNKCTTL